MSIADLIRTARTGAELSQAALARRVGASDRTVARWEAGTTKPNARQVPLIAAATGKPIGFFENGHASDSDCEVVPQH